MLSRRLLRIKVVKALFAHLKSGADNMMASEKTLMASVDKAYDLYFQILILPVEIARYAEQRQELAKQKKLPTFEDLNPNTKFVDNAVIRTIANSDAVNDHVAARKLGWKRYPELIRTLYAQLTESDYYKDYMQREERSFDDDKKLLEDFFKELQSCEALDDVLEEMSILWTDDLPYIVIMVLRTLSNLRVSHTELKVPAKFKSSEDPEFVKTLFEKSLVNYSAFQDYIEKFTANWDVERIVFMDNLIIGTAMAELTSFPSVPVKVTLDEWIEISKYYSTPGSSTFINGVLDKIVESLTVEGRIKKAGRGLICPLPAMTRMLAILALAALAVGCGTSPRAVERKGRIISLTDSILTTGGTDTVRFGRLGSGEIAVLRLWLANDASRPMAVASYRRSCGCTTLEFDAQPIAPGDARQVTLTFDSRGERGWQLKALDITLAGGQRPLRLFVEADIK